MIFDALAIDNTAAMQSVAVPVGEAVNALVVHDRVKQTVEASGSPRSSSSRPRTGLGNPSLYPCITPHHRQGQEAWTLP